MSTYNIENDVEVFRAELAYAEADRDRLCELLEEAMPYMENHPRTDAKRIGSVCRLLQRSLREDETNR